MMPLRSQRGDTLVEVTIALAILALVLMSSFAIANRAFGIGQNAKERTQLVGDAQQQAEALINFRDSHTWNQFVRGNGVTGLNGISIRNGSGDCVPTQSGIQTCFHMERQTVGGVAKWMPMPGAGTDTHIGNQGYVRIVVVNDPDPTTVQGSYNFSIQYGIPAKGGGQPLASDIKLFLTDTSPLRR